MEMSINTTSAEASQGLLKEVCLTEGFNTSRSRNFVIPVEKLMPKLFEAVVYQTLLDFYVPHYSSGGHIVFALSVGLSVGLSVCANFNILQ
ncbi:hypothetical protein DPMN_031189 [Dreissena polymorpha]|uniref:Uncharacterized protein n=1 Tax=Dreissena polymorpha TaxID=45954 RepID=A0A9D4M243_DREPO|nr:hypothetical protein DPMN_031189 [Dreissena polymorpha]